jgi:hypothetical protein
MSVQLARYLKDFGAPERARPAVFQPADFGAEERFAAREEFSMAPVEPAIDVEAERAEAFAEGRAAAEGELSDRHAREVTELRDAHAAELDALRHNYEKEYAAALAERFSGLTAAVGDLVAAQVAHVIAPVMNDELTKKAVADLARMVTEGLHADEGMAVTVKGPATLFEQLKSHFGDKMPAFRHVEMQDVDLTVEFGETVLVTRMAAWADTVRKVLV